MGDVYIMNKRKKTAEAFGRVQNREKKKQTGHGQGR